MNRMKADLAREGDGLRTRRCRIFLGLEGAIGDLLTGTGVAMQRRRSLKGWWIFSLPSFAWASCIAEDKVGEVRT